MTKVTIIDIAKSLKITPSTVSRALSDDPRVKESTREAVKAKAKELGYQRNVLASSFRRGVTNTVGIIVPRINRAFFSSIIGAAENVLGESGYNILICQSNEHEAEEQKAIKALINSRVAGIMISHSAETTSSKNISELDTLGIKLVQFDRVFHGLPGSIVINDDFNGAYNATKNLIDNGYKRIGALVGYMDTEAFLARYRGYRLALQDAGIPYDDSIVYRDTIVRENGYECAGKAIDAGCDALYSSGDFSALGAMECARDRGLSIPKDFGIVGTANENFTAIISPSLSSVDQNPSEIGRKAAEEMLKLINGESTGRELTVATHLIVRQSSTR